MNFAWRAGGRMADWVGRDSRLVAACRPWYERALNLIARDGGIPWRINGVTYRVSPTYRDRMPARYDPHLAEWLRARVRPNQTMFDIGANAGIYVLQFAHWSALGGKVVAVEPNPAARAVLEEHVRLNGLEDRVEVIAAAVSARAGSATLFAAGTDGMSRLGAPNPILPFPATPVPVPVVTIDDLCGSRVPDWLFIDTEGFEFQALAGAARLIATRRADLTIVVEMHPDAWAVAGTTRERAEALLRDLRLRAVPLSGQDDPLGAYGHTWLQPE